MLTWLKSLLQPMAGRNRMVRAIVSKLDNNRIDGSPELHSLLRRYVGVTYNCVNMVASAMADAATPQLWIKLPQGTEANFPTGKVAREYFNKAVLKSNTIDTVGTENVEQVLKHPFLDLMMDPNPLFSSTELWEISSIYLDLAGVSYWYKVKDALGTVKEVWPLPPAPMRWRLSDSGLIDHWLYGRGTQQQRFETDEIVHFKRVSPLDMIKGYSPLRGALTPADASTLLQEYEKSLIDNRAVPDLIMTVRGVLSKEKIERNRELWDDQFRSGSAGGLALIPGDDVEVMPLAWKPKDMEYIKAAQQLREDICAAFGVPISMLTMESSNRAVAEAGLFQMSKFALRPRLNRMCGVINRDLLADFDDSGRLFVAFPDPVPENKELAIKERESNIRISFSTINEERRKAGLPPLEGGDQLAHEREAERAMQQMSDAERQNPNDSATRVRSKALEDEPGSMPRSTGMNDVIVGFFETQRKQALQNVDRLIKHEEEDDSHWEALLALLLLPFMQRAAQEGFRGGQRVLVERGFSASRDVDLGASVEKKARRVSKRVSRSVVRTTSKELRKEIAESVSTTAGASGGAAGALPSGAPLSTNGDGNPSGGRLPGATGVLERPNAIAVLRQAVRDAVNKVFDRAVNTRADKVTRTETKRATEEARREMFERSGVTKMKWVATLDENTCQYCRSLNGRIVEKGSPFVEAKGKLQGSDGGTFEASFGAVTSPPVHPNCRCVLVPVE